MRKCRGQDSGKTIARAHHAAQTLLQWGLRLQCRQQIFVLYRPAGIGWEAGGMVPRRLESGKGTIGEPGIQRGRRRLQRWRMVKSLQCNGRRWIDRPHSFPIREVRECDMRRILLFLLNNVLK